MLKTSYLTCITWFYIYDVLKGPLYIKWSFSSTLWFNFIDKNMSILSIPAVSITDNLKYAKYNS